MDSTKQQCKPEPNQLSQPQQQQPSRQRVEEPDSLEEDRHNFALSKDGAKVVACNKEAKKCSAILDTDSDTFMKNDCKADKWFIVELSQVCCAPSLNGDWRHNPCCMLSLMLHFVAPSKFAALP